MRLGIWKVLILGIFSIIIVILINKAIFNPIPENYTEPTTLKTTAEPCEALAHFGMQHRLHDAVLKKMNTGNDLTTTVIGASVTHGGYMQTGERYIVQFNKWAKEAFLNFNINFQLEISTTSGTGSDFFSVCLPQMVDLNKTDILLIEAFYADCRHAAYLPNYKPNPGKPMEELIRNVWIRNPNIHIVLVNFPIIQPELVPRPQCGVDLAEDFQQIVKYYEIPSLDLGKLYKSGDNTSYFTYNEPGNRWHPYIKPQKQMADALIAYFKRSISMIRQSNNLTATNVRFASDVLRKRIGKPLYQSSWIDSSRCLNPSIWLEGAGRPALNNTKGDMMIDAKNLTIQKVQFQNICKNGITNIRLKIARFSHSKCQQEYFGNFTGKLYTVDGKTIETNYNVTMKSHTFEIKLSEFLPLQPPKTNQCSEKLTIERAEIALNNYMNEHYICILHLAGYAIAYDCC